MENNSNAIAEIQKKYAGCNLLMPAATEVQLNPFYKITVMEVTADLSENSGDIFKVGSVKTGTTQQGKENAGRLPRFCEAERRGAPEGT